MKFNYHSVRAQKARFGAIFDSKALRTLIVLLGVISVGVGGYCLYCHNSLGWILIGAGLAVWIFLVWIKKELLILPTRDAKDLNGLLSRECLIMLKKDPTTEQLAKVACNTASGHFLAARYGIVPPILDMFVKICDKNADEILDKAFDVSLKLDSERVSGGAIAIGIIECTPNYEEILSRLKLEISDLYDGMNWYNYLHGLVKSLKEPRHTGGIARDLMFGYTPTLQRFGQNMSAVREGAVKINLSSAAQKESVDKMVQIFSSGGRQNVAIIGPSGCGRHTIVEAFADRLLDADSKLPNSLKFRQIFKLDASSMVSVAGGRGEIEGLIAQIMNEAYSAKNMIIWLDNAQLFFEEGVGSVDISNVLLPILEAGNLRMILTMNEQRYLEISARDSALANSLNKIMVEPLNEEETMRVMQDRVPFLEYKHNVTFSIWALKEAYRLSERYIHDLVMPGRAINLLESAAGFAEGSLVTDESVQQAIEKTYGVKMQATQTNEDKQRLLNLESLIHERMIGQDTAVRAVSDALRRAAAGVRNENRPIGTFLFMGPTGVGKTELAKALSDVYFKGEGKIVRIDLNEFVDIDSVNRLIADGAVNELSLTAQVMKQPFSVVLLDEIEKAHPKVLTTLLQLLDEGILRDANNREVSFRDTIVIATSNAGADKIRAYIDRGDDLDMLKDELTNELIATGEFKPEFLNRFDEICVFTPLDKPALLQIVGLIIDGVNKTLEPQKISVELDDEAKGLLVEKGYDPKLGARPMRRIVQSTVENIVAKAVLSNQVGTGAKMRITKEDIANN